MSGTISRPSPSLNSCCGVSEKLTWLENLCELAGFGCPAPADAELRQPRSAPETGGFTGSGTGTVLTATGRTSFFFFGLSAWYLHSTEGGGARKEAIADRGDTTKSAR